MARHFLYRLSPSYRGEVQVPLKWGNLGVEAASHLPLPPWSGACQGARSVALLGSMRGCWGILGEVRYWWCWQPWLLHWSGSVSSCPQSWGERRAARQCQLVHGPSQVAMMGAWGSRNGYLEKKFNRVKEKHLG